MSGQRRRTFDRRGASDRRRGDRRRQAPTADTSERHEDGHPSAGFYWLIAGILTVITELWYTATLDGVYGTPQDNQYIQGLEWRAMGLHPMGFANENIPFYWQYEPEGGQYGGLIPWV